MSKRDLFISLIKLFGLFALIYSLFLELPNNATFLFTNGTYFRDLIFLIVPVVIRIGLFYLLVIKADLIYDFLKLNKGPEDNDQIIFNNIKNIDLIKLGLLFIGGIVFIQNLQSLIDYLSIFLIEYQDLSYVYVMIRLFKMLIGFLIFTNYKKLGEYLDKKNK